jgi:hypothetical protein
MTEEDKYYVALGMKTYGGGFVQCLGMALAHADPENANTLEIAFPHYFKKYHTLGKELHEQESNIRPTEKSPEIDDTIEKLTGINRKETIKDKKCAFCSDPDLDFKDEASRIEYTISGICQKCQDEVFG